MPNEVTLAIQAGGASRRMGRDKSLLPFLGQALIQRVAERASQFCADLLIISNDLEKYRFLNLPVHADRVVGAGPIAGLQTAFEVAQTSFVAVVGCDMPFVNPNLLAYELQTLIDFDYDVVIPRSADSLEPLHALYRRENCLAAVQSALDQGNLRLVGWMKDVRTFEMPLSLQAPYDPQGLAFMNVNSPEEFQQAEQTAARLSC